MALKGPYKRREKLPTIREDLSIEELDLVLEKNYGYKFSDFYLSFKLIWVNWLWPEEKQDQNKISFYKKEIKELRKILDNLIESGLRLGPYYSKIEGRKNDYFKLLNDLLSSSQGKKMLITMVINEQFVRLSRLYGRNIFKTYKIACVWALVIQKQGKPQWEEIWNLLRWFKINLGGEYAKKLGEAKGIEDPDLLKKAFHNLKKDFKNSIEEVKFICFEWEGKNTLLKMLFEK